MGVKAVVLGASGFAGGELLRILDGHHGVEVIAAAAATKAGNPVSSLYPWIDSLSDSSFVSVEEALSLQADVVFASLPHTQSMGLFGPQDASKVIDLGGDFRLRDPAKYESWFGITHSSPEQLGDWVYGLTELNCSAIADSSRVANPGCYAAASLLALAPLVKAGAIDPRSINIAAMSGVSGAGRAGGEGFDFSSANENTRPYAVTGHKHIGEIEQELNRFGDAESLVGFTPHLVPMTRGIVCTCTATAAGTVSTAGLIEILSQTYGEEPFVRVLSADELPETKRLTGTNFVEVTARFDERTGRVIAIAALDNLGKGAAGQAVQNMNVMFGFPETSALGSKGMTP